MESLDDSGFKRWLGSKVRDFCGCSSTHAVNRFGHFIKSARIAAPCSLTIVPTTWSIAHR
jgi:hypothetical protein